MRLFYVLDDMWEMDLFVRAESAQEALVLWRDHFEFEAKEVEGQPMRVFDLTPHVSGPVGPIAWTDIEVALETPVVPTR